MRISNDELLEMGERVKSSGCYESEFAHQGHCLHHETLRVDVAILLAELRRAWNIIDINEAIDPDDY